MKKCVHILAINDTYLSELRKITLPNLKEYASRIGAEVNVITERKYDGWPITYEKFQIYEYGMGYDWNVFIDLDTVIHPKFHDVTLQYPKSTISFNFAYHANTQLKLDKYFARDGRNVGVATNFVVTSDWTHDFWQPLDISKEEALSRVIRQHIVDEYCASRNLARYGLKYLGVAPTPEDQKLVLHIGAERENEENSVSVAKEYIQTF